MTLKEKVGKELPGMIVPETGFPLSCPGYYRTVRLNDDHTLKNCKQILENENQNSDNVNHPEHYTGGSIECIDAMAETQGADAVKNFCVCNAFKYLWRHEKKNGVEDVKKAIWYLNKFVELETGKDKL